MGEVIEKNSVELSFDNRNFDPKVNQSIQTIDKFKSSLDFSGAKQSMLDLQNSVNSITFDRIATSLDYIASRVSPAAIAVNAVITNIANNITNTIGGAITGVINQIKSGGISRAFKIENAKFSLAGLGVKWEEIYPSLDKAVTGTAYGLDAAASAASSLVASGVALGDEMTTSLSSIAAVAAQTNSSYEDIASIFTTVAGNGRLMSMQLQQLSTRGLNAAATMATAMGKTETEIRDMVSKGQIDFKTFSDAMFNAFGENAGKANETLEGILKNIKSAWGRIGQVFVTPLIEQNGPLVKLLQSYKNKIADVATHLNAETGRLNKYTTRVLIGYIHTITKMIDQFDAHKLYAVIYRFIKGTIRIFRTLVNYLSIAAKAFNDVLPKGFLDILLDVAKKFNKITKSIYDSSKQAKNSFKFYDNVVKVFLILRSVAETYISAIKAGVKVVKNFVSGFASMINVSRILDTVRMTIDFITSGIQNIFNKISGSQKITDTIYRAGQSVANVINKIFQYIEIITKWIKNIDFSKFDNLKALFNGVYDIISKVIGAIGNFGKKIGGIIDEFFKKNEFGNPFETLLGGIDTFVGKLREAKQKVEQFIKPITDKFPSIPGLFDNITKSADGLSKVNIFEGIKSGAGKVLDKLKEFGEWIINSKLFQTVSKGLQELLKPITDVFAKAKENSDNFSIVDFIIELGSAISEVGTSALEGFAKALGKINDALGDIKIGDLVKDILLLMAGININTFVTNMSTISTTLTGTLKSLNKSFRLYVNPFKNSIIRFAQAIALLVGALVVLSLIPQENIDKALQALIQLMTAVTVMMKVLDSIAEQSPEFSVTGKGIKAVQAPLVTLTDAMNQMATSILKMSLALYIIGKIDPERLNGALFALTTILGEMTAVVKILSSNGKMISGIDSTFKTLGKTMIRIAAALYIVAQIDKDKLDGALLAIMTLMAELGMVAKVLAGSGKLLDSTTKIISAIGSSILLIAASLYIVSQIDKDRLNDSLMAIMVVMAELGLVAKMLASGKNAGKMGVSLVAIAASVMILANALKKLSGIKSKDLKKAMLALTAIFAEILIFTKLAGSTKGIIRFSAGLLIMGNALLIFSIALKAMSKISVGGLAKAIVAIGALFAVLIVSSKAIQGSIAGLFSLAGALLILSTAFALFGAGVLAITTALSLLVGIAPLVVAAGTTIIAAISTIILGIGLGIMEAAAALLPEFLRLILDFIKGMLNILKEEVPEIFNTLMKLLLIVLTSIAKNLPVILEKVWSILVSIGEFLYDKIDDIVNWLAKFIGKTLADLVLAIPTLIDNFITELSPALEGVGKKIINAIKKGVNSAKEKLEKVIDSIWENLKNVPILGDLLQAGKDIITNLVNGIKEFIDDPKKKIKEVWDGIVDIFSNAVETMIQLGKDIINGLTEGIRDTMNKPLDAIGEVSQGLEDVVKGVLGIHSPSKVFTEIGEYLMQGLSNGIGDGSQVISQMDSISNAIAESFNKFDIDADYQPTITPVVDLSNVNSAAGSINGLFGNRSIGLSSNIGAVSASMREIQNTDKNAGLIAAINGLNGTTNNNVYNVNGITYDDGSNIADAVGQLINAAMIERRM